MKIRLCESCGYRWESETFYASGDVTKCPDCGAEVRGESVVKGVKK